MQRAEPQHRQSRCIMYVCWHLTQHANDFCCRGYVTGSAPDLHLPYNSSKCIYIVFVLGRSFYSPPARSGPKVDRDYDCMRHYCLVLRHPLWGSQGTAYTDSPGSIRRHLRGPTLKRQSSWVVETCLVCAWLLLAAECCQALFQIAALFGCPLLTV